MLCPVCRQSMLIVEFHDIELDTCPECQGVWFDAQELVELFELLGAPEQIADLDGQLDRLPHSGPRRACPRCRDRIRPVSAPTRGNGAKLILDECPHGHGLWFDKGELESLFRSLLDDATDALAEVRKYLGNFVGDRAEELLENSDQDTD